MTLTDPSLLDLPPFTFVRIRNSSSPGAGPCALCALFAGSKSFEQDVSDGIVWRMADVPMPPYHPNCNCSVTDYRPQSWDEVTTVLPPLSDLQRSLLITHLVFLILSNYTIPKLLLPFVDEAMNAINNRFSFSFRTSFSSDGCLRAVLVEPGPTRSLSNSAGRFSFSFDAIGNAFSSGLFDNLPCFIDHSHDGPSIRNLLGSWSNVSFDDSNSGRITATLVPIITDTTKPILSMLDQIRLMDPKDRPDIGPSLVIYADSISNSGEIQSIKSIESADLVAFPAVPSAKFLFQKGVTLMSDQSLPVPSPAESWPAAPDPSWDLEFRRAAAASIIDLTDLPALVKSRLKASSYSSPDDLNLAVDAARSELAALHADGVISLPGRPRIQVSDPLEEAQHVADFLFGFSSASVPGNMRRVDEWYKALTGDFEFRGVFDPSRVAFAAADTTTLTSTAVNAMNKVLSEQISFLTAYRWYERIVSVEPNDGSLNPMQWITIGGISNLPVVAEGAAYTELSVADVKESSSFSKLGGYVGITRELLKNSDIAKLQAIPRALATAAIRSRSAAVSNIFTAASGVGPTLAQDSTPLFDNSHSNYATSALGTDATSWRTARAECFQHTDVHSGKPLAIFPRFLLVPAELYDQALSILGYGAGMPTSYSPEALDRGFADPRPIPLVVPDWTDATDWAYIVDPQVFPVIQMSYSQAPGGRTHPAPELFAVTGRSNGLLFTNDTLPIKVRDEFAVGVNGPRGIGKRNVSG